MPNLTQLNKTLPNRTQPINISKRNPNILGILLSEKGEFVFQILIIFYLKFKAKALIQFYFV